MSIATDFKKFITRGNVIDLAVGIIMGAAFTGIVNSLVTDIIMPPIGMAMGGIDFTDFFFALNGTHYDSLKAAKDAGAPVIAYGAFLNTVLNFLIVSAAVFLLVKQVSRLYVAEAAKPAAEEVLLTEIRDLLKEKRV